MFLSIVSPVYKAKLIIPTLIVRIEEAVKTITNDYEIILVDDGCPENSWEVIQSISRNNFNVKGIKLSRNFGQHHAITAGLHNAKGDWTVVLDCDLQDQPEEIPRMYSKALEGYLVVQARRKDRVDGYFKELFGRLFYGMLYRLTGWKHDSSIANFGIYNKIVVDTLVQMKESVRVFPVMVDWVGFKSTSIDVVHAARFQGKSSYNFKKRLNVALDILLAYSDKPLMYIVQLGIGILFMAVIITIKTVFDYFSGKILIDGFTSLMISIWFLSGILVFVMGVVGLYVGKIYTGVKGRPNFIIENIVKNDSF